MRNKPRIPQNLNYLQNKPKTIWWEVIAPKGADLGIMQDHDLVFDETDYKIRQLPV